MRASAAWLLVLLALPPRRALSVPIVVGNTNPDWVIAPSSSAGAQLYPTYASLTQSSAYINPQRAAIWYKGGTFCASAPMSVSFKFTAFAPGSPTGGATDGLCFVLQASAAGLNALGINPQGLGFTTINTSMAFCIAPGFSAGDTTSVTVK